MIKNITVLSAALAVLLFTGCSKSPAIDATGLANGSTSSAPATATNELNANANAEKIQPVTEVKADASTQAVKTPNGSDGGFQTIFFSFDKFEIEDNMQNYMASNISLAKSKANPKLVIKLEGNCDEFGSDEYNYALGLKRAKAVKSSLVNAGVNGNSITLVSLGKSNPLCTEKTDACWAQNRRVDFKLP